MKNEWFEGRELTPWADGVAPDDLIAGEVYFSVHFIGEGMLVPVMETMEFLGEQVGEKGEALLRFQYVSLPDIAEDAPPEVVAWAENPLHQGYVILPRGTGGIYTFETALEVLMGCSLRRRAEGLK